MSIEHVIKAANTLYKNNGHIYYVIQLDGCDGYEIYRKIHLKNINKRYTVMHITGN